MLPILFEISALGRSFIDFVFAIIGFVFPMICDKGLMFITFLDRRNVLGADSKLLTPRRGRAAITDQTDSLGKLSCGQWK